MSECEGGMYEWFGGLLGRGGQAVSGNERGGSELTER